MTTQSDGNGTAIPRSYWREVPCGHPPDPIAMHDNDGRPVCHCGTLIDSRPVELDVSPVGPIHPCHNCGCFLAVPPAPRRSALAPGVKAHLNTTAVLMAVQEERRSQDAKWGEQRHDPAWWLAILVEEVGEAAQEVLGLRFGDAAKAHGDLRKELLHVAAVAVSAIETLDFGAAGEGLTFETQQGVDA